MEQEKTKYRVCVYELKEKYEIEVLAANEQEASQIALDSVESGKINPVELDNHYITIIFDKKSSIFDEQFDISVIN